MAFSPVATPPAALAPGVLFYAPAGTAEPTHVVAGSVFTDSWPAAWTALGATDAGSTFNYNVTVDQVQAAEFLDPLSQQVTGRAGSMEFAVISITANMMKRSLNGGTVTTTGTTATTLSKYTPPQPGTEVRAMIGWESQDSTERIICYQTLQTGSVGLARAKGAARAQLPMSFAFEIPASGIPFAYLTAGAVRLGV